MAMTAMDAPRAAPARIDATRVGALVLVRASIGDAGVGEPELVRDLQPLVSSAVEPNEWRLLVGRLLAAHIKDELITRRGSRLVATEAGRRQATRYLGMSPAGAEWSAVRDQLIVAVALGMPGLPARRLKALSKIDGLRCAIVTVAHGLKLKTPASPSKLRNSLALLALDRAFGNRLQRELGSKSGLSAKAGRLLAGQLSARPRDFGTDSRLVAALAAEAVGTTSGTLPALRMALLRAYVTGRLDWPLTPKPALVEAPRAEAKPSQTTQIIPTPAPAGPAKQTAIVQRLPQPPANAVRPTGPDAFARAVRELARPLASGWSGSRKVYISHLWSAIREQHAGWGLSEIEFKAMLTEAHRTGLLALGTSDLRDKRYLEDIQASATVFKNTVWHYVRVDE